MGFSEFIGEGAWGKERGGEREREKGREDCPEAGA